jgi:hypothetical protein
VTSALGSHVFGAAFEDPAVADALSDRAYVRALLGVEVALAHVFRVRCDRIHISRLGFLKLALPSQQHAELVQRRWMLWIDDQRIGQVVFHCLVVTRVRINDREVDVRARKIRVLQQEFLEAQLRIQHVAGGHGTHRLFVERLCLCGHFPNDARLGSAAFRLSGRFGWFRPGCTGGQHNAAGNYGQQPAQAAVSKAL